MDKTHFLLVEATMERAMEICAFISKSLGKVRCSKEYGDLGEEAAVRQGRSL